MVPLRLLYRSTRAAVYIRVVVVVGVADIGCGMVGDSSARQVNTSARVGSDDIQISAVQAKPAVSTRLAAHKHSHNAQLLNFALADLKINNSRSYRPTVSSVSVLSQQGKRSAAAAVVAASATATA